ncbi:MAG: protein TolQ [Candidatus Saccharicenans sp.]|nr:protein TolQ [Candidatus Saccharicenans sp.]
MNVFSLISQATIVVKLILLILILFSVFSWAIIIHKRRTLKAAEKSSYLFLEVFRKSKSLNEVNEAARRYKNSPLAVLFQAGFKELVHLTRSNPQPQGSIDREKLEIINRSLLRASSAEIRRLERMMSFLATCGSVTPFIGLLGTVWGIMDSFHKIGLVRSASLVTVAPGIAEALVATAVGLFAAIPAVIAYNYFLGRIKEIISMMDDFSLEFLNIIERAYGS